MNKILAIGEIIWDVYPERQVIGGAPLNFAAHCALCGAKSALLSAVGNDGLGKEALLALLGFGVDEKYVKTADKPTGQCLVTLDENAVPRYNVLCDVAYDNVNVTEADVSSINAENYDALYFGTLIQRAPVSRRAVREVVEKCRFEEIICDVNLRPDCYDAESVVFCLENATVLKVSIEEEPILRSFGGYCPDSDSVQSIAKALCQSYKNLKIVLITLGGDGSYAYCAESGEEYREGAVKTEVVSTVGAGDSFAAAWLTCFLEGKTIPECMKKAAQISGFVVGRTEAIPKY